MTDNQRGKTKSAILQELESIQGLLRDDDNIPVLQEVFISEAGKQQTLLPNNSSMATQDLDALHQVFQTLSHTINNQGERSAQLDLPIKESWDKPALQKTTHASNQLNHPVDPTGSVLQKPPLARQQSSLFSRDFNEADITAAAMTLEPAKLNEPLPRSHVEKIDKASLAHDFSESVNYSANASITRQPNRPSLAKASGENPFLPQHIRARLHGNNPPPLFDEPLITLTPQSVTSAATSFNTTANPSSEVQDSLPDRQKLVQEVITNLLPQIQMELRQRLQIMTEDELIYLLNQEG